MEYWGDGMLGDWRSAALWFWLLSRCPTDPPTSPIGVSASDDKSVGEIYDIR